MDLINLLEKEIADLTNKLQNKEKELIELKKRWILPLENNPQQNSNMQYPQYGLNKGNFNSNRLPKWAIMRYSRQILLPDIGVQGQEKLCAAKVLVVGAGGLGCPAAVYLAGAGVGEIGIVDYDTVDITNIHRQILHGETDERGSKAESAAAALRRINSRITVTTHNVQLDTDNSLEMASKYHVILDCSDNVPTRYMLSDVCALTKLPLISGSALKMEGQLTIYGYRVDRNSNKEYAGPCYRCVFPVPPPAEAVGSCSASGVAGPVPGVIGCLQALEAIKIITGQPHKKLLVERMLIFDGEDMTFRTVRLRPRNVQCAACSDTPTITQLLDYESFCKAQAKEMDLDLQILPPENRITAPELARKLDWLQANTNQNQPKQNHPNQNQNRTSYQRHLLVDVRSEPEFKMCNIDGSVNYPLDNLREGELEGLLKKIRECTSQVTFICRRGNDSQIAAKRVLDALEKDQKTKIKDLAGGLHAWSKHVDHEFPVY